LESEIVETLEYGWESVYEEVGDDIQVQPETKRED
jgi:hypothetical protein